MQRPGEALLPVRGGLYGQSWTRLPALGRRSTNPQSTAHVESSTGGLSCHCPARPAPFLAGGMTPALTHSRQVGRPLLRPPTEPGLPPTWCLSLRQAKQRQQQVGTPFLAIEPHKLWGGLFCLLSGSRKRVSQQPCIGFMVAGGPGGGRCGRVVLDRPHQVVGLAAWTLWPCPPGPCGPAHLLCQDPQRGGRGLRSAASEGCTVCTPSPTLPGQAAAHWVSRSGAGLL